jgi:uncharacterized protein (TIGR03382 family)
MTREANVQRLGVLLLGGALAWALPATAEAATPTYYNNQMTFQQGLVQSVTDPYSNAGYVFIQTNAVMSAVLGETDYESTGHQNLNIVSGGVYCAGCNGSFRLTFTSTSVGNAQGVDAVGMNVPFSDQGTPYFAFITFGDGTTANIQMPGPNSYWGVSAPQKITNIHFGLSMGGTTTGGSFGIDNLQIGSMEVPTCMVAADCADDANPCTLNQCVNSACVYPADPNGVCPDDGNSCTLDQCNNGQCQHPADPNGVCTDDDNECTDDVCQNGMCVHLDNSDPCDDADACTELDTCNNGSCNGTDVECNDQNICSLDSCDPMSGCINDPVVGCCFSDADCQVGEICLLGSNSCIPDPDPDTGTDTTTDSDTSSEGTTTGSDTTGETGSDDTTSEGGSESSGGSDGGSTGDGFADEVGGLDDEDALGGYEGYACNCTTDERGGGALACLLGLALLAGVRRRRD